MHREELAACEEDGQQEEGERVLRTTMKVRIVKGTIAFS